MKNVDWDFYQVFLTVARSGGLTGAAEVTGLSPATIGRRMLALEQALGRKLFERSQTGYVLTRDGQMLWNQLADVEGAIRKMEIWQQEGQGNPVIKVTAGTWNAWLIAENFPALCTERDHFRIDLLVTEQRAMLARRQTDIAIRAVRPEESSLAVQWISDCAYAVFACRNAEKPVLDRYVAVAPDDAISAYLRWPHENVPGQIVVQVTRPRSLLDLIRAGAGIGVLPCFVGDLDPMLERVTPEIETLRHGQWIVMNNEDRHRREVRTVIDRLTKLMKSHVDLYIGKRPNRSL